MPIIKVEKCTRTDIKCIVTINGKIIATKYSVSFQTKTIISTKESHVITNYCTCD